MSVLRTSLCEKDICAEKQMMVADASFDTGSYMVMATKWRQMCSVHYYPSLMLTLCTLYRKNNYKMGIT